MSKSSVKRGIGVGQGEHVADVETHIRRGLLGRQRPRSVYLSGFVIDADHFTGTDNFRQADRDGTSATTAIKHAHPFLKMIDEEVGGDRGGPAGHVPMRR